MKIKHLLFLSILVSSLFFLSPVILAQGEEDVVVTREEVIDHDFFAAGDNVMISGVINGDAFLAGGNVFIDGEVNGDLLIGGGEVKISGKVTDDVRVGGGNVTVTGTIGKNLTVGAGNVSIDGDAKIEGSLLAFAGNIFVNGPIGRDAQVFAGSASFSNQVGRDLKGAVQKLTLGSSAQILGDLEYESSEKAKIAEGATVSGKITYKPSEKESFFPGTISSGRDLKKILPRMPFRGLGKADSFKFFSFVLSFILGLVFIALFPKRADGMVKVLGSKPWTGLGVGFITPIVFSLIMILLTISLIGIPLVLILVPLFGFLLYFSKVFTALYLGGKLLPGLNISKSRGWSLFVGLLAYYLLRMVPVVRALVVLGFALFGLGAFVLDQKTLRRKPAKKKVSSKS